VAVGDLGLVRLAHPDATGRTGSLTGTPAYLAPESVLGENLDPALASRADVYALAVVGFELLTGHLPFDASAPEEILRAHVEDTPPRVSEVRPDVAPVFDDALARALAKDPGERTASAEDLRRELLEAHASLRARRR